MRDSSTHRRSLNGEKEEAAQPVEHIAHIRKVAQFIASDCLEYFRSFETGEDVAELRALAIGANPEDLRSWAVDKAQIMREDEEENAEGVTADDVDSFSPRDSVTDARAGAQAIEKMGDEFSGSIRGGLFLDVLEGWAIYAEKLNKPQQ